MKLLYVTAQYPNGTSESFLQGEVASLVRAGVDVVVRPVRPTAAVRPDFGDTGAEVTTRRLMSKRNVGALAKWAAKTPLGLVRLLKLLAGDRAHLLKNLAVVPSAVEMGEYAAQHEIEHIHAHWLSTSSTAAMIAASVADIPFSVTAHRWDIVDGNLLAEKFRTASFVRFISESGRSLTQELHGLEPHRSAVIHLGVRRIGSSSHTPSSTSTLRILVPAALKPVKGHRTLLDALSSLPDLDGVSVDLAGDGPLRDEIAAELRVRGLDRHVRMRGNVPHGELLEAVSRGDYDAVVLPSLDLGNGLHEGIPVSLMEAMSAGLPVISTRTGGIPELLTDGVDGMLVEGGDSAMLAAAIDRLRQDTCLRVQLGENALETISRRFDADTNARALVHLMATTVPASESDE